MAAIGRLSDEELAELHAWLSSQENHLEMTDAFEAKIKSSERQVALGQRPRTR